MANHHVIESLPKLPTKVYRYNLVFDIPLESQLADKPLDKTKTGPEAKKRDKSKASFEQIERALKKDPLKFLGDNFIFDGVSDGWSPDEFMPEGESKVIMVTMEERASGQANDIKVTITNMGTVKLTPLVSHIRSRNLELNPNGNTNLEPLLKYVMFAFRRIPKDLRMTTKPNANAFFPNTSQLPELSVNMSPYVEARRGVFHSMLLRFGQMTMNIDTSTSPFWIGGKPLSDCVEIICNAGIPRIKSDIKSGGPGKMQGLAQTLNRDLEGLVFRVKHLQGGDTSRNESFKAKLTNFTVIDAFNTKFEQEKGKPETSISVYEYYKKKYKMTLKHPELPLAASSKGNFPIELCWIADNERYKGEMTSEMRNTLMRFATGELGQLKFAPAKQRKQHIELTLQLLKHHRVPFLQAHGLSMNPKQMELEARVLKDPIVQYKNLAKTQSPLKGKWDLRENDLQFIKPGTKINTWYIAHEFQGQEFENREIAKILRIQFQKYGIPCPNQSPPAAYKSTSATNNNKYIEEVLASARVQNKLKPNENPDIVFFMIRSKNIQLYREIKTKLDCQLGIVSQVITIEGKKHNPQFFANIALKCNVKLGGYNCHIVDPFYTTKRVMMLGGDVCHGGPGGPKNDTSYSALVGSYNTFCTAYTAETGKQEANYNMIQDFKVKFLKLMEMYKSQSGNSPPDHIVYYRDGVSEGEFKELDTTETSVLRDWCAANAPKCKITVIVAIKRHHTRFFSANSPSGNVPVGTVVENSFYRNDSFIASQIDLKGTKRPTHYITVFDNAGMTPDEFHRITNGLCQTYQRSTTCVGLCAPVYYADKAAERAYIWNSNTMFTSSPLEIHSKLRRTMWWQ